MVFWGGFKQQQSVWPQLHWSLLAGQWVTTPLTSDERSVVDKLHTCGTVLLSKATHSNIIRPSQTRDFLLLEWSRTEPRTLSSLYVKHEADSAALQTLRWRVLTCCLVWQLHRIAPMQTIRIKWKSLAITSICFHRFTTKLNLQKQISAYECAESVDKGFFLKSPCK